MTALVWGVPGERIYETGIDRGVFYPSTGTPSVWTGLVSVDETGTGGEEESLYLDGVKRYSLLKTEDYAAEVKAFAAPVGFNDCNGMKSIGTGLYATQQPRSSFGFSYRTLKGNDLLGNAYSYKIHLVYNAIAESAGRAYKSITNASDPEILSWSIVAVPPTNSTRRPTAHLTIDVSKFTSTQRTNLENALYGTASTAPYLPTQSAVATMLGVT